jgi:hypothetical protein
MKNAMKSFMKAAEAAATASGLPFDLTAETLRFCNEYVVLKGFCDESGVAQRLFDDWASNADVAEQEVLQSNDQYPRGLIGTVRLVLHELHCLGDNDAASSRQLLSILALCPSVNTPWSLFLGHDGSCISGLDVLTGREGLERIAALLQRSGLVQVQGERSNPCIECAAGSYSDVVIQLGKMVLYNYTQTTFNGFPTGVEAVSHAIVRYMLYFRRKQQHSNHFAGAWWPLSRTVRRQNNVSCILCH